MTPKVRVLHILPSVQGYGAERQIIELLKSLESEQVEPLLATVYEPPDEVRSQLPFRVVSAARKGRSDVAFWVRLVRAIRAAKPDVVHTHTHVGKYWGRLAGIAAHVPHIVHTEHNPCDVRRNPAERVADAVLHRATCRVITFFSEQGAFLSRNERLPASKIAVIPNGLQFDERTQTEGDRRVARASLGIRNGDFALMLIGRMEFQKNQALALRALAALPAEVAKRCVLAFAGGGRDEPQLRALARELNVAERVRFLGYRHDVPHLLAGIDAVLMTSWFEGMPLALIEAMIAGTPIVSTPWTGSSDMLGNGRYGILAADFSAQSVARAVADMAEHPSMRQELARRARLHAHEQYGIARMIDAHRRLYLSLCGQRAS